MTLTVTRRRNRPSRGRLVILMSVLHAIAQDAHKPTHIMYASNQSWAMLRENLTYLVSHNLVEAKDGETSGYTLYYLTDRGVEAIRLFSKLEAMLGADLSADAELFWT